MLQGIVACRSDTVHPNDRRANPGGNPSMPQRNRHMNQRGTEQRLGTYAADKGYPGTESGHGVGFGGKGEVGRPTYLSPRTIRRLASVISFSRHCSVDAPGLMAGGKASVWESKAGDIRKGIPELKICPRVTCLCGSALTKLNLLPREPPEPNSKSCRGVKVGPTYL